MIDWTIRSGDIASFLGFLIAGLGVLWKARGQIDLIAQRLGFLEDTVKRETDAQNRKIDSQSIEIGKFGELLVKMGRYEERIARTDQDISLMRKQIEELKHGQGWVNGDRLANAGNPGPPVRT